MPEKERRNTAVSRTRSLNILMILGGLLFMSKKLCKRYNLWTPDIEFRARWGTEGNQRVATTQVIAYV